MVFRKKFFPFFPGVFQARFFLLSGGTIGNLFLDGWCFNSSATAVMLGKHLPMRQETQINILQNQMVSDIGSKVAWSSSFYMSSKESIMGKSIVEMAAEIVQSQCSTTSMSDEEIAVALQNTFKALQSLESKEIGIQSSIGPPQGSKALVSPEKSIQRNKIVCLECGQEFRLLSPKHLRSHGLTSRQYREKYGFSLRQPLCARSLSERRKKAGKERGLPENLRKAIAKRKKRKKAGS
jgi:predicted transcriptional regulator